MHDPTFEKDPLDRADAPPDWGNEIPFDGTISPSLPQTVELTWPQFFICAQAGLLRYISSRQKDYQHKHGYNGGNGIQSDIAAAAAEYAVSLAMNISWVAGVGTFKEADNGNATQVRATEHKDGCLIVRKDDPDTHRYVLVVQEGERKFKVVGWMFGADAKQERWHTTAGNSRPPAYFVPQKELNTW